MNKQPKIKVTIRKRPITKKELSNNQVDIIECKESDNIIVRELREKLDLSKYIEEHDFVFDQIFKENVSNEEIYNEIIKDIVDYAFEGAKSTCFAYGQTGSGKTYTMMGKNKNIPGLYLIASNDIFSRKNTEEFKNLEVKISFYDIYCSKLYDLWDERKQLILREDGKGKINIVGLKLKTVNSVEEIFENINLGLSNRVVGQTGANIESSRSHAILDINIYNNNKFLGKVSFIDLAGNERGADTIDNDKQTKLDGAEIKKSLLALKECIRALDQNKKHLKFRGSKLTLVLKDSFIGKCKTVMIGCVNPCNSCCELTLNTLRYADRVKELKSNKNKIKLTQKQLLEKELWLPRQNKNKKKCSGDNILLKPFLKQKKEKPKTLINLDKNKSFTDNKNKNLLNNKVKLNNYFIPQKVEKNKKINKFNLTNKFLKPNETLKGINTTRLVEVHKEVINDILKEEEDLLSNHNQYINKICTYCKSEVKLLKEIDKPQSNVNTYMSDLGNILDSELNSTENMIENILKFKEHLEEEKKLNEIYQKRKKFTNENLFENIYNSEDSLN